MEEREIIVLVNDSLKLLQNKYKSKINSFEIKKRNFTLDSVTASFLRLFAFQKERNLPYDIYFYGSPGEKLFFIRLFVRYNQDLISKKKNIILEFMVFLGRSECVDLSNEKNPKAEVLTTLDTIIKRKLKT